jgi:sulfur transfer protein SufE
VGLKVYETRAVMKDSKKSLSPQENRYNKLISGCCSDIYLTFTPKFTKNMFIFIASTL